MYSFHAPEAKRLYDFEPLPWDSHGNMASQGSAKRHHTAPSQICFLSAATGKAFTTVFAGFALTLVSLPNITFTHACVAGLLRVLMRQIPGSVKMPVFFTSFVARAARLVITPEQAFCFKPCSVAMAFVNAPFVIAFALAFMDFIGGSMTQKRW